MNKHGQVAFIGLIMTVIAIIIFVLALPFINDFVNHGVANSGSASGFFIRLFPWVILVFLLYGGYRAVSGGGS